jgi:hypothetical protein
LAEYQIIISNAYSGIYISRDYGNTWIQNIPPGTTVAANGTGTLWISVAISASGQYITACTNTNTNNPTDTAGIYSSNINSQSIAIGLQAGTTGQGPNTIAIGAYAGQSNQNQSSIVLNASGTGLTGGTTGFFVAPVRTANETPLTNGATGLMQYNTVSREIQYTTKSFIIDHPTDTNRLLVHACLEGPESGVYYRGEADIQQNKTSIEIILPHYVSTLATDYTVQITPIYTDDTPLEKPYRVSRIKNGKFTVYGEPGSFFWHVYGKRFDIDVEPLKSDVTIKGQGPYKWI